MITVDSRQPIYLAADALLLLASDSVNRESVIDVLIDRAKSSSYITGVTSLTAVARTFRKAGAAPAPFLRFISPLLDTVLAIEERDLLDALRIAEDRQLSLDHAIEASLTLRHTRLLFSMLETFDRVPGVHRLAT